jgi:predicted molibdopterin-dependent oxidoreductase YjgC
VVADYALTETAQLAHLFIPLTGWPEMEGTTVNFQGVAQKTARAVVPPRDRKAFHEVVSLWLAEAGMDVPEPTFLAWHARVKEMVPAMKDLSIRDLLPQGAKLEGGAK